MDREFSVRLVAYIVCQVTLPRNIVNIFRRLTRRQVIEKSVLLGGAAAAMNALPGLAAAAESKLGENGVVLFQGDSITDAGRAKNREGNANDARAFGDGYAFLIASQLLSQNPSLKLKCYNRGISGHKVPDLQKRWDKDCFDLKPTVLSILIGVNDIWHKLNGNYDGTVAVYETGLKKLLDDTRAKLPDLKIIVCEPFALRCGAVNDKWFPEMDQRREACKKVVDSMGVAWVPFQTMFDEATNDETPPNYWAGDGVHPSMAGHALMAKTWLEVFNA